MWEISHFQNQASADSPSYEQCGTFPADGALGNSCADTSGMRLCAHTNPDTDCRDHIRWELSRTRSAIYVNGVLHDEHNLDGFPLPEALTSGDVYVFLSSVEQRIGAPTTRFHWDSLAINP